MTVLPRPVFVIGPERSGTGLLAWSLGQHPNLAPLLSTEWLERLVSGLASAYASGLVAQRRSHLGTRALSLDEFLEPFRGAAHEIALPQGAGPAPVASAPPLREGGERRSGPGRRWVDHTPGNAFRVYELLRLFPDARFIHVFREAETAVPRLTDLQVSKLFRTYYNERQAYVRWLEVVRACLEAERAFGSDTVLRVAHRELVESPEQALRRCLGFLGEPWDSRCMRLVRGQLCEPEEIRAQFRGRAEGSKYAVAREALALSREVVREGAPRYPRDEERVAGLESAFLARSRPRLIAAGGAPLTRKVVDAACANLPAGARVLVVSRGDDALLELEERRAEHFPQTEEGTYAGYHPADSAEAIAHLEALRARGAQYLLFPSTAFWWLDHYEGFRLHLEERYRVVLFREDACVVYGLDRGVAEGPRLVTRRAAQPEPAPPSPPPGVDAPDAARVGELRARVMQLEETLGMVNKRMLRWDLEGEIQRTARANLPAGARVLVVSRGDDALLELEERRAEHFPQTEEGTYAGYHPADSAEAIAHLEALRARGAQYLLFPSTAFWWLDHYEGFRLHLEERYPVVGRSSACLIFGLAEVVIAQHTAPQVGRPALSIV